MDVSKKISERIELIVLTFQVGRKFAEGIHDQMDLVCQLKEVDEEYRSMAFEGASMAIAIRSLEANDGCQMWSEFLDSNIEYATQIMIGYGWAIGEKGISPEGVLGALDPMIQGRALDGYGYYMGLFKRRISIRTQQIPEDVPDDLLLAYDQGIGRSLWYISKGDLQMLGRMMESFPEYRQKHMWLGLGVACPIVGGYDVFHLKQLGELAGDFKFQLATGCTLAARSSIASNTENIYLDQACELWLNCSKTEAAKLTDIDSVSYPYWIEAISESITGR